jgi:hypothetical protein
MPPAIPTLKESAAMLIRRVFEARDFTGSDDTVSLVRLHSGNPGGLRTWPTINWYDTDMISEFLKKMENHAMAEATRLGKSNHGKLRLIGMAIGIVVVILLVFWMAYHP